MHSGLRSDKKNAVFLAVSLSISAAVVCLPLVRAFSSNTALLALITAAAAALFAFVYLTTRSPLCYMLPLLSYLAAFAATGDPIASLTSTAFFPPAFILTWMFSRASKAPPSATTAGKAVAAVRRALGFADEDAASVSADSCRDAEYACAETSGKADTANAARRPERISAVAAMSAALLVCGALYIVFSSALTYSSLSFDSLVSFFNAQNDRMRAIISSFTVTAADGTVSPLYTDEAIEYMVSYIIVCLPSILICAANIIAYLTTCFFSAAARLSGIYPKLLGGRWDSSVSIISAALYTFAYIFSAIGSASQSNALGAVTTNLIIMLTPAFALMGVKGMWRRMRESRTSYYGGRPARGVSALGLVYLMLCAAMLFINPFIPVILLAFLGTADTIIAYAAPFLRRGEK
ncbi:MAG: hypothetical protein WCQ72_05075 [Eubacteriales bacterium]